MRADSSMLSARPEAAARQQIDAALGGTLQHASDLEPGEAGGRRRPEEPIATLAQFLLR